MRIHTNWLPCPWTRSAHALLAASLLQVVAGCSSTPKPDGAGVPPVATAASPAPRSLSPAAGGHYQAARNALAAGDLDQAGAETKLALQADPRDAAAHFLLGCLLAHKGENDQALVAFQRAATLDPANPDALYNLGTLLLRRGEAVPAARLLENAVLVRADHVPSYNNLGKAYFLAGLPELAVAAYEEALRREPANPNALRNLLLLAEGAGLKDAAATCRQRLAALGSDAATKPALATAEPIAMLPAWPTAKTAAGVSAPVPRPAVPAVAAPQAQSDPEVDALRALLRDLPHVTVERRAGRLTVNGWTSGPKEKEMLGRIIGKPAKGDGKGEAGPAAKEPEVLDLTGDDSGDPQRMIEVDAVLFSVSGLDQTSLGFNFLDAVKTQFGYAASGHYQDATAALPATDLWLEGWNFSASVDYLVNIANVSDLKVAVLARPHLTTLSGTPATFLAGGELVYKVSGINSGDIKPYPFGTTLTVTPTLLRSTAADGSPRVYLKAEAGRTSVLALLDAAPDGPTNFQKIKVTSEAVLNIDQTLILSGLSQRESRAGRSGVPWLRAIPLLKYLFSSETNVVSDSAVVILLTPRDPAFLDQRTQKALADFVGQRRAFLDAQQGGPEAMQQFREHYPDWTEIAPNRFASHFFLMENSEIYRAVSQQELRSEDVNLQLLGPVPLK